MMTRKIRERFRAWVDGRQPAAARQRLNHHCLYIFPSRAGLAFIVLAGILWLVGTNYENNLVLALAFLLVALFVVTILHTYANLSGLRVQLLGASPAISGELAEVRLRLARDDKRPRDAIQLQWAGGGEVVADLLEDSEVTVSVFVRVRGRGWFDPGRLIVDTRYPLGILRCWTRVDMDCRILVYPRPIPAGPLPRAYAIREDGEVSQRRGADEFTGYREYQPGDSPRTVAWKHYARGLGLHSKDYAAVVDNRLWLDWDYLGGMDREARLSRLCYWVLEAGKTGIEYGIRLPGESLPPDTGPAHREQALRMLALFEVAEGGSRISRGPESGVPARGEPAR